jgi:DNA-binding SARP family transcriptional activator
MPAVLTLTGGFELTVGGEPVPMNHSGERLLAFLALAGRFVTRSRVYGELWSDSSEPQASTNLRTALWRMPKSCAALVSRRGSSLGIAPCLRVDVVEMAAHARAVTTAAVQRARIAELVPMTELLPGWSDAWVVVERERLRMMCLEALEFGAMTYSRLDQAREALELAAAVIRTEPLRETAWRLVIETHRQQGNLAAAAAAYSEYRELLRRELGIGPSVLMEKLVAECGLRACTG